MPGDYPEEGPPTHLDDEDYDAFLSREFDARGHIKGDPPIARYVVIAVIGLIVLAIWLLR